MGRNLLVSAGDTGSIPGLGRFLGEGNSNPLQYSCLENPMLQSMGSQELDMTEQQHILEDRVWVFALWEPSLNPLPEIYPKNWSD